jgi:hypothetical protein
MSKLRRRAIVCSALSALACVALLTMLAEPGRTQDPPNRSIDIGSFHVDLDSTFLQYGYLRAFVATGSDSGNCLVTLQEASPAAHMTGPVFCGTRTHEGQDGVMITVFFLGPEDAPEDVYVGLTVFHERARYHTPPVPFVDE